MPPAVSTATKVATGVWHYLYFPLGVTIHGYTMIANASGSIVIDIWNDVYDGTNLPTDADSITGAAPPTLSTAQFTQVFPVTWTNTVIKNDSILGINVDSSTTISYCVLTLHLKKAR